jgi:hypothetical protein
MKTLTKIERKMKTNKSNITYVVAGFVAAVFISAATPASAENESPADISICDNQGQNCQMTGHTESFASRIHAGQ